MTYMEDNDSDSEDDEETSERVSKNMRDWKRLRGFFFETTSCLNLWCIDFTPSTAYEMRQLKLPKSAAGQEFWTASFFCKEQNDWYIYRVILSVEGKVTKTLCADILSTLTKKALNIYVHRARTKNPLLYLREILLD
jgi:hypothetical protein